MDRLLLCHKLASLPENFKKKVSDFSDFLAAKNKQQSKRNMPIFGSGKGMFVMKPDFDEPIEDFKDYM